MATSTFFDFSLLGLSSTAATVQPKSATLYRTKLEELEQAIEKQKHNIRVTMRTDPIIGIKPGSGDGAGGVGGDAEEGEAEEDVTVHEEEQVSSSTAEDDDAMLVGELNDEEDDDDGEEFLADDDDDEFN